MEVTTIEHRLPSRRQRGSRALEACGDEGLVERIAGGDTSAFAVFYERHHRGLLSLCRHTLGSREEAEDVVQHTFMAAYRQLGERQRTLEAPRAWLYTVARNRCLSLLRSRREPGRESAEPATAGLDEEVQRRSDLRDLLSDVAALPEEQRSALILSELGDLSHDEIAGVLDRPTAQVKGLVFRARSALIEGRTARDTTCSDIREQLSTLTGGSLRRGALRRHLALCSGCSDFREQVRRQRAALGIILPVVPAVGLQDAVAAVAAVGSGGAGLAAAGAGGAGASALSASAGTSKIFAGLVLKAGALKTTAVVVATGAVAAGGGIAVERTVGVDPRPGADSRADSRVPVRSTAAPAVANPSDRSGEPAAEPDRGAKRRARGSDAEQRRREGDTPNGRKRGSAPDGAGQGRGPSESSPGRDRPVGPGHGRSRRGGEGAPREKKRGSEQAQPNGRPTGGRPVSPRPDPPKPPPGQRPESAAEPGAAPRPESKPTNSQKLASPQKPRGASSS